LIASPDNPTPPVPATVVAAFALDPATLEPAPSGLINRTWFARRDARAEPCVVQRVNAVFPPETQHDIEAVTRHLERKGLVTPRLIRTRGGALWIEADGATWRALTFVDGLTFHAVERGSLVYEAGRALGAFHVALGDLEYTFVGARAHVHDTDRHLEALGATLRESGGHRHYAGIAHLAAEVLECAEGIETQAPLPARIVHGDPKISNVVFDRGGERALCLIDLDTVARMPVMFELGDALRSWCNPAPEDSPAPHFSLALAAAALEGYAAGSEGLLEEAEWRAIAGAPYRIAVELAARFCRDALTESYFAWDATRYASASEHHQARTRSQLDLARDLERQSGALAALVEHAFGRG
jgi:Ser/Thr protein kinase RdoA (MazF antagonist)